MKRLLAIVLSIIMLISSSGITIASMVCTKGAAKRTAMCQLCQKSKSRSTDKKSCCKQSAKFFAVKSNFSKPVSAGVSPLVIIAILGILSSALVTRQRATVKVKSDEPPLRAEDKCVRISRFRI
jgi:hypothetical protein